LSNGIDYPDRCAITWSSRSEAQATTRDCFVLLTVDGEWRIANKPFSVMRTQ
jgi:hypothetical protein